MACLAPKWYYNNEQQNHPVSSIYNFYLYFTHNVEKVEYEQSIYHRYF